MSDSSSSVWGHSVHLGKFPILRFSKGYSGGYSFRSFHPISARLFYGKYGNQEEMQTITFLAICQI